MEVHQSDVEEKLRSLEIGTLIVVNRYGGPNCAGYLKSINKRSIVLSLTSGELGAYADLIGLEEIKSIQVLKEVED